MVWFGQGRTQVIFVTAAGYPIMSQLGKGIHSMTGSCCRWLQYTGFLESADDETIPAQVAKWL